MLLRMGGRGRVYNMYGFVICDLCGELAYVGGTACSLIYYCCWCMRNGDGGASICRHVWARCQVQ